MHRLPLRLDKLRFALSRARRRGARGPDRLAWGGLLSMALLAALPAQAEIRFDRMSGAALLGALRGEAELNDPAGEAGRAVATTRAHAYIDGVLDAGVPQVCPGPALKPQERDARVFDYLAALPPARLRDGAAPLVRLALRC
ncbi:Rap1a/Tai family immunity protein [Roseomonas sp. USHLN139]|uniref:Rap1a/Tai family immunity protein n=1 Tax=Roseomonas sp. USHLN139 TaxID=3081298 RepID=UPI003B0128BD